MTRTSTHTNTSRTISIALALLVAVVGFAALPGAAQAKSAYKTGYLYGYGNFPQLSEVSDRGPAGVKQASPKFPTKGTNYVRFAKISYRVKGKTLLLRRKTFRSVKVGLYTIERAPGAEIPVADRGDGSALASRLDGGSNPYTSGPVFGIPIPKFVKKAVSATAKFLVKTGKRCIGGALGGAATQSVILRYTVQAANTTPTGRGVAALGGCAGGVVLGVSSDILKP